MLLRPSPATRTLVSRDLPIRVLTRAGVRAYSGLYGTRWRPAIHFVVEITSNGTRGLGPTLCAAQSMTRAGVEDESLTRRQLLGRAMLAGAGTTIIQGLTAADKFDPAQATTDPAVDPNFVMGQVVSYDSASGALQILDLDLQVRAAQLTSASQIWKQGLWNTNQLAQSDCIMSRGLLDPNNTLMIDEIYADIRSFQGALSSVSASSVSIVQSGGGTITAGVTNLTQVNVAGQTTTGSTQGLAPGQYANLIGYGDPSMGALVATLIIGPSIDTGGEPPPVVGSPGTGCTAITYNHSTTWFCCGNVTSACGANCAHTGPGSCGNCRADKRQMAWPNLSTTSCNSTCNCGGNCCRSIRSVGCGALVDLYNPCRNKIVYNVYVADCGPCVHCVSPPCDNLDAVTFDLTPCTFTALGAPLSQGIQACSATSCFS